MDEAKLKKVKIVPVKTTEQIEIIETLAREILPEFYAPYIPVEHVIVFIETFQTVKAVEEQIRKEFLYYLFRIKNTNAGYLGIQIKDKKLLLSKLYISKNYRGHGLGQIAMDIVDTLSNEKRVNKIELVVNRQNQRAIEFYQRNGYVVTENLLDTLENGYTVEDYKMTKYLNP